MRTMRRFMATCGLLAVLLVQAAESWAGAGELVSFTALRNAQSEEKVTINALIFRPEGGGAGKTSSGGCCAAWLWGECIGILASRKNQLSMRHQNMADLIVSQGLHRAVSGQLPLTRRRTNLHRAGQQPHHSRHRPGQ